MSANFRTDCFYNLSQDERIDLFKRRQGLRIENVFRSYFGWVMLPLALCGTILTIIFLKTVYEAIKARRVSRKCYILILNRSIGDLLSCVCALMVCGYTLLAEEINRDMVVFMESFFTGSFWSAMVSYVALSVLKLFAVWKPFHYKQSFTMKRCIYLIIFSWIMFVFWISYTLGISALVKIPALNEWSGCKMETCLRIMYRSRNFVTASVYFFTLFVFVGTVILIRRAQRFVDSFKKRGSGKSEGGKIQGRARFPLWKLALNVGTFAGLYMFYVIWCIGNLLNRDQCFWQKHTVEMMRILALVRCTLVIRIIIDPLISFCTDFQLRRGMLALFGIHKKIAPHDSRGPFHKSTVSEYNSSINEHSNSAPAIVESPDWKFKCGSNFDWLKTDVTEWGTLCIGLLLNKDQCFFQRNYAEMMRILALVRCTLVLRIVIDPILSFITDFQLRRGMLALFGVHRKIASDSSRGVFQKSTVSDFNSSTYDSGPNLAIDRVARSQTVHSVP